MSLPSQFMFLSAFEIRIILKCVEISSIKLHPDAIVNRLVIDTTELNPMDKCLNQSTMIRLNGNRVNLVSAHADDGVGIVITGVQEGLLNAGIVGLAKHIANNVLNSLSLFISCHRHLQCCCLGDGVCSKMVNLT